MLSSHRPGAPHAGSACGLLGFPFNTTSSANILSSRPEHRRLLPLRSGGIVANRGQQATQPCAANVPTRICSSSLQGCALSLPPPNKKGQAPRPAPLLHSSLRFSLRTQRLCVILFRPSFFLSRLSSVLSVFRPLCPLC